MGSAVALTFEGVLKAETGDSPIRPGTLLYHGALAAGQVAILVDHTPQDQVNHWLEVNGLRQHSWLVLPRPEDPEDVVERRLSQVARLRVQGAAIELVVEANPLVAAALQAAGLATALFLHPRYARPEFRPDYDGRIKHWDEVLRETERQALLQERERERREAEVI